MTTSPEHVRLNGRSDIVAAAVPPTQPFYDDPTTSISKVDANPLVERPALLIPLAAPDESDEETLEDLADQIQQAHLQVTRACEAVVAFAVRAGQLLLKARPRVPRGAWEKWVELNCQFSLRTARDYVRIARALDEGRIDADRLHAAGLDSLRQVLAVLREQRGKAAADESAAEFIAWDKGRQRFISWTEELDDVGFADPKSRALFRKLVCETVAALWRFTDYPQGKVQ